MNRNYADVQRWGLPKVTSFAIDKEKHIGAFEEYRKVHDDILDTCKKLIGQWSLTLCLRGRYLDTSKPTVLIVHDTVQSNFEKPNVGSLSIEVVFGPVKLYHKGSLDDGLCIGVKSETGCGSFGGYLRRTANNDVFGLTCGHVAYGNQPRDYKESDIDLYRPAPSHIHEEKNGASQTELARLEELDQKLPIGKIICGEISVNGPESPTMDWALIKLEKEHIGDNNMIRNSHRLKTFHKTLQVCDISDRVWKHGHSTGFTMGSENGEKSDICLSEGIISRERTIIGNFSAPGDSGSWVANEEGVCGIVIGGNQDNDLSFISDFRIVLNRINEKTDLELEPK
jgi:hypothetical protein